MADETVRALRKGITAFADWCAPRGLCPLPAEPHVRWHREQVFQGLPLAG